MDPPATTAALPCSIGAHERSFDRLLSACGVLYLGILCSFLGCTPPIASFYDCSFRWYVSTLAAYRHNLHTLSETDAIPCVKLIVLVDWFLYTLFGC